MLISPLLAPNTLKDTCCRKHPRYGLWVWWGEVVTCSGRCPGGGSIFPDQATWEKENISQWCKSSSLSLLSFYALPPLDRALHLNAANADETWPKLDQRSDKKTRQQWLDGHPLYLCSEPLYLGVRLFCRLGKLFFQFQASSAFTQ